ARRPLWMALPRMLADLHDKLNAAHCDRDGGRCVSHSSSFAHPVTRVTSIRQTAYYLPLIGSMDGSKRDGAGNDQVVLPRCGAGSVCPLRVRHHEPSRADGCVTGLRPELSQALQDNGERKNQADPMKSPQQ